MGERDEREEVYEVRLPISDVTADVIGIPAEWFERAVRRCGKRKEPLIVEQPLPPIAFDD